MSAISVPLAAEQLKEGDMLADGRMVMGWHCRNGRAVIRTSDGKIACVWANELFTVIRES